MHSSHGLDWQCSNTFFSFAPTRLQPSFQSQSSRLTNLSVDLIRLQHAMPWSRLSGTSYLKQLLSSRPCRRISDHRRTVFLHSCHVATVNHVPTVEVLLHTGCEALVFGR